MTPELAYESADGWIKLYHGDGAYFRDDVDLVLTNPYCRIPEYLREKPMILSHEVNWAEENKAALGVELTEIGRWNIGPMSSKPQAVWVANMEPRPLDLTDLSAEIFAPYRGWWPLDLPLRLLERYGFDWRNGDTADEFCVPTPVVLDPCMGRGTVGRACQLLELKFVGVDIDRERVDLAAKYLGLEATRC